MAGIGSNIKKGRDMVTVVETVKTIGSFPAIVFNKPEVSVVYDVTAPPLGVSRIAVASSHKTVSDPWSSGLGLCSGTGESTSFENELGSLTTLGKANLI